MELAAWAAHRNRRVQVRTATKNQLLGQLDRSSPGFTLALPDLLGTKVGRPGRVLLVVRGCVWKQQARFSPASRPRLKQWRGIATRYDKHAVIYRGAVVFASVLLRLKDSEDTPY